MVDIAIVEADAYTQDKIRNLIKKQRSDCRVVSVTGTELLGTGQPFDIVFWKHSLTEGEELQPLQLRRFREDAVFVVMTAAEIYNEADLTAPHFLQEPVEEDAFLEVFERAILEAERRKILGYF
ncbi:MAG: hypothetical protein HFI71_08700 [Lachnospiraceae bacterium]|jgi:hypothetical protein|nr:hypothetical protein [Lachnospiraceae bacterium]